MQKEIKNKKGSEVLIPVGISTGDLVKGRYFMSTLIEHKGEQGVLHIDVFSFREIVPTMIGKKYRVLPQQIIFSTSKDSYLVWTYHNDRFAGKSLSELYSERVPSNGNKDPISSQVNKMFESIKQDFGIILTEKELKSFMSRNKLPNPVLDFKDHIGARSELQSVSDMRMHSDPSAVQGKERRAGETAAKTSMIMTHIKR